MSENRPASTTPNERIALSRGRLAGLFLIILATAAAVYLLVGYSAWQSGQALRSAREEALQTEQLARQITLAQDDIRQGSFTLALRRVEWVLERDPSNAPALALREQAEGALRTALTSAAPASPTPPLEPAAAAESGSQPAETLQRLESLRRQEQWQDLLEATLAFQQEFPGFERLISDGLLYDAYLNLGLEKIQGEQIESGIYYFTQAEKLGDLSQEALDYWLWAELYLQGMAYYGVNWGVASGFLRDLCLAAPFYQGSCDKLYDALIGYAEQYAFAGEWCPAAELFREARQFGRSPQLDEKLSAAVEGCAAATPTPQTLTTTLTITATEPLEPAPSTNE